MPRNFNEIDIGSILQLIEAPALAPSGRALMLISVFVKKSGVFEKILTIPVVFSVIP